MGEGHSNTTGHGARGPTGGVKGGPGSIGAISQHRHKLVSRSNGDHYWCGLLSR